MSESAASSALGTIPSLGQRVRRLRTERALTLQEVSERSGLARSTLSKIENDQLSPTYDALIKLAAGFGVEVGELFASQRTVEAAGRRSILRAGNGVFHKTPYYEHVLLCNELSHKSMIPFKSTIVARSFDEFEDWSRHVGEEFIYVLSGRLRLYTEFYEPVDMAPGDCCYIDSRMGHRVVSLSEANAEVLWMSTTHP